MQALHRVFADAVNHAIRSGMSRAQLAEAIDVSPKTFEHWLSPGRIARLSLPALLELIGRDAPWPAECREALMRHLATSAGMVVVDSAKATMKDRATSVLVLEVVAAVGKLASFAADVGNLYGERGVVCTPRDAKTLLQLVHAAEIKLAEARLALEQIAEGK